ncbi:hypothetical protein DL771_006901 [Monosporascus sp. 5C6A]|nr:hypothetical protein DL771_006901 [Monosporascus sp. 5C6A]
MLASSLPHGGYENSLASPELVQNVVYPVLAFLRRIAANEDFTRSSSMVLVSVVNVTARNFLSVFIPTVIRQFVSYGMEAGFQKIGAPKWLKAMVGTLSGTGVALTTHAIGCWRDESAGTASTVSRRSRAIMAGTALATGIAELAAGTAADNASAHFAFTVYTGMRDLLVQSRVRLCNPNTSGTKPDWTHFGLMMAAYGIDQGLVSLAMSTLASPSGPSAWAARLGFCEQLKHAVVRGTFNLLGEIVDDLMFQAIPSVRSLFKGGSDARALQLSVKDVGYQKGYLANGALGPWAVRTGNLTTTTALLGVMTPHLAKHPVLLEAMSDLVIALVNGFLYEPFANSGSAQPDPVRTAGPEDKERGTAHGRDTDTASIRSYAHPNVDMTNDKVGKRWAVSRKQNRFGTVVLTESSLNAVSFIQPQRFGLLKAQESISSQSYSSSASSSIRGPGETPLTSRESVARRIKPRLLFGRRPASEKVQTALASVTANDRNAKYVALEAQLEREELRAAAGGIARIDLGALRRNYRLGVAMLSTPMASIDGGKPLPRQPRPAAVLKANAYGLGADIVSKALVSEGCRDFFVARIAEAVELRKYMHASLPDVVEDVAINVLDGNIAGADPRLLIKYQITPVLNSLQQVREWNAAGIAARRRLPAVLQFDTGMSRAGMSHQELEELLNGLARGELENIDTKVVMTHLAKASETLPTTRSDLRQLSPQRDRSGFSKPAPCSNLCERLAGDTTQRQLAKFEEICKHFPDVDYSIGASSTVFLGKHIHKDMVRMGGILHGQAPFDADSNPMEQVLTLKSKIAQINEYKKGAEVGYGGKFVTREDMTLATIPLGYADGLPRRENGNREDGPDSRPYVLVSGKYKCEFVGANSMDMSSIDVTNVPADVLKTGVSVTLIGDGLTADHLGKMFDTHPLEMQTKLASRVFREYLDENPPLKRGLSYPDASPHTWGKLDTCNGRK